jgi:hypothetical protein
MNWTRPTGRCPTHSHTARPGPLVSDPPHPLATCCHSSAVPPRVRHPVDASRCREHTTPPSPWCCLPFRFPHFLHRRHRNRVITTIVRFVGELPHCCIFSRVRPATAAPDPCAPLWLGIRAAGRPPMSGAMFPPLARPDASESSRAGVRWLHFPRFQTVSHLQWTRFLAVHRLQAAINHRERSPTPVRLPPSRGDPLSAAFIVGFGVVMDPPCSMDYLRAALATSCPSASRQQPRHQAAAPAPPSASCARPGNEQLASRRARPA